jgi:hypothetical protein
MNKTKDIIYIFLHEKKNILDKIVNGGSNITDEYHKIKKLANLIELSNEKLEKLMRLLDIYQHNNIDDDIMGLFFDTIYENNNNDDKLTINNYIDNGKNEQLNTFKKYLNEFLNTPNFSIDNNNILNKIDSIISLINNKKNRVENIIIYENPTDLEILNNAELHNCNNFFNVYINNNITYATSYIDNLEKYINDIFSSFDNKKYILGGNEYFNNITQKNDVINRFVAMDNINKKINMLYEIYDDYLIKKIKIDHYLTYLILINNKYDSKYKYYKYINLFIIDFYLNIINSIKNNKYDNNFTKYLNNVHFYSIENINNLLSYLKEYIFQHKWIKFNNYNNVYILLFNNFKNILDKYYYEVIYNGMKNDIIYNNNFLNIIIDNSIAHCLANSIDYFIIFENYKSNLLFDKCGLLNNILNFFDSNLKYINISMCILDNNNFNYIKFIVDDYGNKFEYIANYEYSKYKINSKYNKIDISNVYNIINNNIKHKNILFNNNIIMAYNIDFHFYNNTDSNLIIYEVPNDNVIYYEQKYKLYNDNMIKKINNNLNTNNLPYINKKITNKITIINNN